MQSHDEKCLERNGHHGSPSECTYCTVLYRTVLYRTVLCCTVLDCTCLDSWCRGGFYIRHHRAFAISATPTPTASDYKLGTAMPSNPHNLLTLVSMHKKIHARDADCALNVEATQDTLPESECVSRGPGAAFSDSGTPIQCIHTGLSGQRAECV